MRNGTITVAAGADATIKEGITPTISAPTGSLASALQDGLAAKTSPLSGVVQIGSVDRRLLLFSATASSLTALDNRIEGTDVSPASNLAGELVVDSDGNIVLDEDSVPTAPSADAAILSGLFTPKPPVYRRFSQVVSALETALEKAGRGGILTFSQDGPGRMKAYISSPSLVDDADATLKTVNADGAALGNSGNPLAEVTVAAGTVSATRLPGE